MGQLTPNERLELLQSAKTIGVSKACEKFDVSRMTYSNLKRRCKGKPESEWPALLEDRPRGWKSHPQQTAPQLRNRIVRLSLKHPSMGCNALEAKLKSLGKKRSHKTIQKILKAEQLHTRAHRWSRLDQSDIKLTKEQFEFVSSYNPAIKDRNLRADRPGHQLFADLVPVGPLPGFDSLYLHVVVDSYSSIAFGSVRLVRNTDHAIWLLDKMVWPFFKKRNMKVRRVRIGTNSKFGPTYRTWLHEHGAKSSRQPHAKGQLGSVERFFQTVQSEFFARDVHEHVFKDIRQLRAAFRKWLEGYNGTPLEGYPNYGKSPFAMIRRARQRAT